MPPRLLSGSRPRFASVSRRAPAGQAGPCLRARCFVLGRRGSAPRLTNVSRGSPTGSRLAEGGLSESAHPRPTPGEASAVLSCGADGAATPDGAVCWLVVASHFLSAPLELSPEARGNGESWGQGEKPRPEPLFCSPPTAGVGERQLPTGTRLSPASPCRRFQGLSP